LALALALASGATRFQNDFFAVDDAHGAHINSLRKHEKLIKESMNAHRFGQQFRQTEQDSAAVIAFVIAALCFILSYAVTNLGRSLRDYRGSVHGDGPLFGRVDGPLDGVIPFVHVRPMGI
jgi:hypothetical protein